MQNLVNDTLWFRNEVPYCTEHLNQMCGGVCVNPFEVPQFGIDQSTGTTHLG